MRGKTWGLLALLVVGVGLAVLSLRGVAGERAAVATCEAAKAGDSGALEASFSTARSLGSAAQAIDCYCFATLPLAGKERCLDEIKRLRDDHKTGPALDPVVAHAAFLALTDLRRTDEAEAVLREGRTQHPDDLGLFLRSVARDAGATNDISAYVAKMSGPLQREPALWRIQFAQAVADAGHPAEGAQLLFEMPVPASSTDRTAWALASIAAAAVTDSADLLERVRSSSGGMDKPPEVFEAHIQAQLSLHQRVRTAEQYQRFFAALNVSDDTARAHPIFEQLFLRAIGTLAIGGEQRAYDLLKRAKRLYPDFALTTDDVRRARQQQRRDANGGVGTLRFHAEGDAGRLWISPKRALSPFVAIPLKGSASVQRESRSTPTRYVWTDDKNREIWSAGSVWPIVGETITVELTKSDTVHPRTAATLPTLAPGDGNRKTFVFLLDSGDWRVHQYLSARGDVPFMSALVEASFRSELIALPATTTASLAKILHPGSQASPTYIDVLQGALGQVEIALSGSMQASRHLSVLTPDVPATVSVLAQGGQRVLNMMPDFKSSAFHATAADVVGPGATSTPAPRRPADTPIALARFLAPLEPVVAARKAWFQETKDVFDTVEATLVDDAADVFLIHIDGTDRVTHDALGPLDNGETETAPSLFRAMFQYVDARLARVYAKTDADDTIILLSDHGTTSKIAHAPEGMLVVHDPRIAPGPSHAKPRVEGFARLLHRIVLDADAPQWPEGGLSLLKNGKQ